jgi:hypothetical protein
LTKSQKHRLALLFAIAWVLAIFAPIVFSDYKPPPEIHGAIPAIIGSLLMAPSREENKKNGTDKKQELQGGEDT